MKLVYKADDGTEFGTEEECKAYESNSKLRKFLNERIGVFTDINISDVEFLIQKHIDELVRIVKGDSTASTSDDGWVSNEGRNAMGYPAPLTQYTSIEVKFRDGSSDTGLPCVWNAAWRSTDNDPLDIIAYRIVK